MEGLGGFDTGINRQFILCQQAWLMNLRQEQPQEILSLVLEALNITFDPFNEYVLDDISLFFEEPRLLHLLASLRARMGDIPNAIRILTKVHGSLSQTRMHDPEKWDRLLYILLDLAGYHLKIEDYKGSITYCDEGIKATTYKFTQCASTEELKEAERVRGCG